MMHRIFLFLFLLALTSNAGAQPKRICETEWAVRWENIPFTGSKTDSLGLPSKTSLAAAFLRSDQLVGTVLKKNNKPAVKENILQAQKRMKILSDAKTGLIVLSFEHPDTVFSKKFMDTLVKIFPVMYFQDQMQLVDKKIKLLDREMDMLVAALNDAGYALKEWLAYYGLLDVDSEKQQMLDELIVYRQEKADIEKTLEAYYAIENGIMAENMYPGTLLAWAGQLTYDTLFSNCLVAYSRDSVHNRVDVALELLKYIKESRKLLQDRVKNSQNQADRLTFLVKKMNDKEPEYRLMRTKMQANEKALALLMQRKLELTLYKTAIYMGELEVVRSPRIVLR